jgi:hypothetical protein
MTAATAPHDPPLAAARESSSVVAADESFSLVARR